MATKRVIVYGGKGSLGSTCVSAFKAKKWWVGSIADTTTDNADASITVNFEKSLVDQEKQILDQLNKVLEGNQVDAIFCVAGGWTGGNAASEDFSKVCELILNQSVVTSVIATSLATKLLKSGGLLTLSGACYALGPTPSMIGYGMAKAAVHHLAKSLGDPESGLPSNSTVLCVLPQSLGKSLPRSTPVSFVADLFIKWCENNERPPTGSLVKLITDNGATKTEIC